MNNLNRRKTLFPSVLGFSIIWPTYILLRPLFPEGSNGAVMSGAAVGIVYSIVAIPMKLPIFPETIADEGRYPVGSGIQKFARATVGNAAFFTIFEGCRAIIRKSQLNGIDVSSSSQYATNFLAGGIAGMVFLAVSSSIKKTPLELDWKLALKTVPRTFVVCGLGTTLLGVYESLSGNQLK